MAYDNQSQPTGVIWAPAVGSTADWTLDQVSGTKYSTSIGSLNLDPNIPVADQIVVIRQFDFSTIASTPSPLLTGAEAWDAWSLPTSSTAGSSMYTIDNGKVIMSDLAADYLYVRTVGGTTTEIQLPTFDKDVHQVYVLRKTQDLTNYINWTSGSRITAAQLNHGLLQLLNIAQELSVMQDNKHTVDPFVGKPGGICPLEADGTISSTYIGSSTLSNTVGDGLEGDGSTATPLKVDLAGTDGADSGLAFDGSGDLKADTVDNLTSSTEVNKPLSAKQGYVLDQLIAGLSSGFTYKGTINADSMPSEPSAVAGDTYDIIGSATVDLDSTGGVGWNAGSAGPSITGGDIIRYDGTDWVEVTQVAYIRADGTVALNTAQKAVTQAADEGDKTDGEEKSVATVEYVEDAIVNTKLDELVDVHVDDAAPTGNDMLYYDGNSWEPIQLENTFTTGEKVITSGSSINALSDVDTSAAADNRILRYSSGDSEWVAVASTADTPVSVLVSATDYKGDADESAAVYTAWSHSTLGYYDGIGPAATTVKTLDFKNGTFLCSATDNGAPAGTVLTASSKRDITYKDGTLQFNEVNETGKYLINTGTINTNTTTISNDRFTQYGQHELRLNSATANKYVYPGALIRTGTDADTQDSPPIYASENSDGVCYAGEMNIVEAYDRSTGIARLRYPIAAWLNDGEQLTIPVGTAVAATSTITFAADGTSLNADAIGKTLILETTSGTTTTLTCVDSASPGANEWRYQSGDTLAAWIGYLEAAIELVTGFTSVHNTGVNPDTIVITQSDAGITGNTVTKGTLLTSANVAGLTNFVGGTSPQVQDQTFENMTFEDLNTGTWHLEGDKIACGGSGSSAFTVTLPRDHGMANGITFDAEIRSSISGDVKTGTDDFYTDLNGSRVLTVNTADETNELRGTLSNSRTWNGSSNTGGNKVMISYGENAAISLEYAHNITFRNCHFKGWGKSVRLLYCDSITFENCTFTGGSRVSYQAYIEMEGCRNINIRNCEFSGGNQAILFQQNQAEYHANCNISIVGNTMMNIVKGIASPLTNNIFTSSMLPHMVDSEIRHNKILLAPFNPRKNWIYFPSSRSSTNASENLQFENFGIMIGGFGLQITDNFIGGTRSLVYETAEMDYFPDGITEVFDETGYGTHTDGSKSNPDGGLKLKHNDVRKIDLPIPTVGIAVQCSGGGRRGRYRATQEFPAALDAIDGALRDNADYTTTYTPKSCPTGVTSLAISRNEISSWGWGIYWVAKVGSSGNPSNCKKPIIDGNTVNTMQRAMTCRFGFPQTRTVDNLRVKDNNLEMYHMSDVFTQKPRTTFHNGDNTNVIAQAGHGDALLWLHHLENAQDGIYYDNPVVNAVISGNYLNCHTPTYKVYGMRIYHTYNQYIFSQMRVRDNCIFGGYQSFHLNSAIDHNDRSMWNSWIGDNMVHAYAYSAVGGAGWTGSNVVEEEWTRTWVNGTESGDG